LERKMNFILAQTHNMAIVNKPAKCHSDEWAAALNLEKHGGSASEVLTWVPAHRLDYETSGCLLVCPPDFVDSQIQVFRSHDPRIEKIYLAEPNYPLKAPLFGEHRGHIVGRYRRSKTVQYLEEGDPRARKKWHSIQNVIHEILPCPVNGNELAQLGLGENTIGVRLLSGARHQIRAFFASLDTPLVGDPLYRDQFSGEVVGEELLGLHAWKLSLPEIQATATHRLTAVL